MSLYNGWQTTYTEIYLSIMAKSSYLVLWWVFCVIVMLLLGEVSGQCLEHQKTILVKLKQSLIIFNGGTRISKWDSSIDCCGWPGVACNKNGYVMGLDLSFERIEYGLNNSSPLFDLQYLTSLNLANNKFQWRADMSSGFERLVNLMHLNMSLSVFTGRFPIEISNLTRLASLDLSLSFYAGSSDSQFNLGMLVGNMSNLSELRLDYVSYLGVQETEWSNVMSSSLPHLKVLSLRYCKLSGSILDSLTKLTCLTYLDLSSNSDLSGKIPESIGELKMLSVLNLAWCNLQGFIPDSLTQLTSLTSLDLSFNSNLSGNIPNSLGELKMLSILKIGSCNLQGSIPVSLSKLTSLTYLDLSYNSNLSGNMPEALGKLKMLSTVEFGSCNLQGPIPDSLSKFTSLKYFDLSYNNLSGTIPSLSRSKNLTYLALEGNRLTGSILGTNWSELSKLEHINFYGNSLSGSIPVSLFGIPTLQKLYFFNNYFGNFTNEPVNTSLSRLEVLELGYNELQGSFPSFIFGLEALRILNVNSNNFSGTFHMDSLQMLRNLSALILSNNNFSVELGEDLQNFPDSFQLEMASCKLKAFPKFLKKNTKYRKLDLSANQIRGEIPHWIWNILESKSHLNLSHNQLQTFESPVGHIHYCEASVVDFSSNMLRGNIPKFSSAYYLDLSHNWFDSTIFSSINMSTLFILFASNNRLQGSISKDLCNATLSALDLSNNFLSGTFPSCLPEMASLVVLNIKNNNFNCTIPDSFPRGCSLTTVILNGNSFHGSIPKSLINCTSLEVLDLGNNKLHDDFPCLMSNLPKLLWSATLSLLDLSNNFFSGYFPSCLPQMSGLTFLSLKNNNITGTIPDSFPWGCSLQTVILNGNFLLGSIPKSLGKCTSLEVLDLGNNKLHDNFPCWMSSIFTLRVLVLQSNMLEGSIICPGVNVSWPSLQILDIKSNNFSRNLPSQQLMSWNSMIVRGDTNFQGNKAQRYIQFQAYDYYDYNIIITLTLKGIEVIIQKISTSLTLIDLSDNAFEGTIPEEFGYFIALYALNMSHNDLRGQIPSSLGNMKNLESLDLQNNQLGGKIPSQLASLNFLSVLNLSFNELEGMIPNGGQFQTFSKDSFLHNKALCGFPLDTSCAKEDEIGSSLNPTSIVTRDVLISAEVGYAIGLGFIIMPLIFWPRWRMRFYEFTDSILLKLFCPRPRRAPMDVR